jgi:hypothetical protein
MKVKKTAASAASKQPPPRALAAIRRAAQDAIDLARRTNTPAWVMVNGKIVDATKLRQRPAKKKRR